MTVNSEDHPVVAHHPVVAIVSMFPPGVMDVEIEQFGKGVQWITVSEAVFDDMMAVLDNWKDPDSD